MREQRREELGAQRMATASKRGSGSSRRLLKRPDSAESLDWWHPQRWLRRGSSLDRHVAAKKWRSRTNAHAPASSRLSSPAAAADKAGGHVRFSLAPGAQCCSDSLATLNGGPVAGGGAAAASCSAQAAPPQRPERNFSWRQIRLPWDDRRVTLSRGSSHSGSEGRNWLERMASALFPEPGKGEGSPLPTTRREAAASVASTCSCSSVAEPSAA
jgi:hypothetical protein